MLFDFLTSDSFLFWTLLAVQSAMIIWFVEAGNATASGVVLATVTVTVLMFPDQWSELAGTDVGSVGVGRWLLDNAGRIAAGVACYFLIGLLWATFRWWLYVGDAREAYDEHKRQWLQPRSLLLSAKLLETRADFVCDQALRTRYLHWANACRIAAATGVRQLSPELKPVWKEFVENGYRH
jgi:hypothetical protein